VIEFIDGLIDDLRNQPGDEGGGEGGIAAIEIAPDCRDTAGTPLFRIVRA
jgi:hypothetical protein